MGKERLRKRAEKLRAKLARPDDLTAEDLYLTVHEAKNVARHLNSKSRWG